MLPLDHLCHRHVHDRRGAVRGGCVRRDVGHDRGAAGDVSMKLKRNFQIDIPFSAAIVLTSGIVASFHFHTAWPFVIGLLAYAAVVIVLLYGERVK